MGDKQTLMCSWLAGVLVSWEWFALMLTASTWESCLGCHEARIRRLMRQGHGTYQGRVEAREGGPYLISNSGKGLSRESGGCAKSVVLKTMPIYGWCAILPFASWPVSTMFKVRGTHRKGSLLAMLQNVSRDKKLRIMKHLGVHSGPVSVGDSRRHVPWPQQGSYIPIEKANCVTINVRRAIENHSSEWSVSGWSLEGPSMVDQLS